MRDRLLFLILDGCYVRLGLVILAVYAGIVKLLYPHRISFRRLKTENEVEIILKHRLPLGNTSQEQVERFLEAQRLRYIYWGHKEQLYPSFRPNSIQEPFDTVIHTNTDGPIQRKEIWLSTVYDIFFHFREDKLVEIRAFQYEVDI